MVSSNRIIWGTKQYVNKLYVCVREQGSDILTFRRDVLIGQRTAVFDTMLDNAVVFYFNIVVFISLQ